ncbi:unnamed protein product [Soboliphyme baturini]|uniref:Transmembrane protein n=1 Tax=Soboliphyme baturini TaxID=241478 RepID=A0A183IL57_9BILA|nr:unnamed protein product [Soboliphyme baturini]
MCGKRAKNDQVWLIKVYEVASVSNASSGRAFTNNEDKPGEQRVAAVFMTVVEWTWTAYATVALVSTLTATSGALGYMMSELLKPRRLIDAGKHVLFVSAVCPPPADVDRSVGRSVDRLFAFVLYFFFLKCFLRGCVFHQHDDNFLPFSTVVRFLFPLTVVRHSDVFSPGTVRSLVLPPDFQKGRRRCGSTHIKRNYREVSRFTCCEIECVIISTDWDLRPGVLQTSYQLACSLLSFVTLTSPSEM